MDIRSMIRHYPSCNPHHPLPVDAVSGENGPHNKANNTKSNCIILIYKGKENCLSHLFVKFDFLTVNLVPSE